MTAHDYRTVILRTRCGCERETRLKIREFDCGVRVALRPCWPLSESFEEKSPHPPPPIGVRVFEYRGHRIDGKPVMEEVE